MLTMSTFPRRLAKMARHRAKRARRRRGYHHGDLVRALIDAAEAMLAEDGAAALSLRAVARRAGVSQTAPYRHFAGKEALAAAVAAEGFRRLAQTMNAAALRASPRDATARIRALGLGYIRFAVANPALLRLMFGPRLVRRADYPALDTAARKTYAIIASAVAARLAAPLHGAEAGAATIAAWALVHGLSQLLIDGQIAPELCGGLARQALIERVAGDFARGLALPKARESR